MFSCLHLIAKQFSAGLIPVLSKQVTKVSLSTLYPSQLIHWKLSVPLHLYLCLLTTGIWKVPRIQITHIRGNHNKKAINLFEVISYGESFVSCFYKMFPGNGWQRKTFTRLHFVKTRGKDSRRGVLHIKQFFDFSFYFLMFFSLLPSDHCLLTTEKTPTVIPEEPIDLMLSDFKQLLSKITYFILDKVIFHNIW